MGGLPPQVWANGELIGGGDIINELNQSGKLKGIILAALESAQITKALVDPAQIKQQ